MVAQAGLDPPAILLPQLPENSDHSLPLPWLFKGSRLSLHNSVSPWGRFADEDRAGAGSPEGGGMLCVKDAV